MEQDNSIFWILNTLEVKICMSFLGEEHWDIFPVFPTSRSLEERVVEAYRHLIEMGFLCQTESGCRKTTQLQETFSLFINPKYTLQVLEAGRMPVFYAYGETCAAVMEQVATQDQMLRLYYISFEEWKERLSCIALKAENAADFEQLSLPEKVQQAAAILRKITDNNEELFFVWMSEEGRKMLREDQKEKAELFRAEAFACCFQEEKGQ